jgi:3-phosphoshikimate 1-carboxyvinyltransferase
VRETNRIAAITRNLTAMGADMQALPDGFVVRGPTRLKGARVSSFGDHRIAMATAVAALLADGETVLDDYDVVDVSYPHFFVDLTALVS